MYALIKAVRTPQNSQIVAGEECNSTRNSGYVVVDFMICAGRGEGPPPDAGGMFRRRHEMLPQLLRMSIFNQAPEVGPGLAGGMRLLMLSRLRRKYDRDILAYSHQDTLNHERPLIFLSSHIPALLGILYQ